MTSPIFTLPARAGIGLKPEHVAGLLEARPSLAFVEVHAENYMGAGGPPHRQLATIREVYPLSVHGVGLSLGGDEPLDLDHLEALAGVVERYEPEQVSEHLAWCRIDGHYLNDLLPIPYTDYSLNLICDHIDQTQTRLKRRILIENPAATLSYAESTMRESDFLIAMVKQSGCGLLLDVNNLFVSDSNLAIGAEDYIAALPGEAIGEIHLAGHHLKQIGNAEIRIDDHGSTVAPEVWSLYRDVIARFGRRPTLIEWDTDVPDLEVLLAEARTADRHAEFASLGGHADVFAS
jgi:uncharacterized protein